MTPSRPITTEGPASAALSGRRVGAAAPAAKSFLWFMGFLLVGYAFGGRGFAYLGLPPVFVGEVGFLLALLVVARYVIPAVWGHPLVWLLVLFMTWGALRTVPFLGAYGIDALRDGAQWGYALFALAVAVAVLRCGLLSAGPAAYGRVFPYLLLWLVVATVVWRFMGFESPRWPWGQGAQGGVEIMDLKYGDVGVHLAGAAAFMALGLGRRPLRSAVWWLLWLVAFAAVATITRGGMLTVACVLAALTVLRPFSRWHTLAAIMLLGFAALAVTGIEIDTGRDHRSISAHDIWLNISSIVASDETIEGRTGTMEWRLEWWQTIIDYTVHGPYFWQGKGFGINLADADGFQVLADGSLRSPHNGHLTLLARGGVPGFALWVLLQGAFALYLFGAYIADRRDGRSQWANVELWVLLYWGAFMVNGTFDVFLEGPQGGIWFWSLFGYGLAFLVAREHTLATTRFAASPKTRWSYRRWRAGAGKPA